MKSLRRLCFVMFACFSPVAAMAQAPLISTQPVNPTAAAGQAGVQSPPSGVGRSVMEGVVHGIFDHSTGERVGRVRVDQVRVEPRRHGFLHVGWRPQVMFEGVTLELGASAKWPDVGPQIRAALSGGRPGDCDLRRVRLLLSDGREVVAPVATLRADGMLDLREALVATNGKVSKEPASLQYRLLPPRAGELVTVSAVVAPTRRRSDSRIGPGSTEGSR